MIDKIKSIVLGNDLLAMKYEYSKMREIKSQGITFISVDYFKLIKSREELECIQKLTTE